MFLAALITSLVHLFRIGRRYQSGTPGHALASSLESQTYTCLRFLYKFETMHSLPAKEPLNMQWARILQLGRKCYFDIDYDKNNNPILPSLSDIVKSYSDAKAMKLGVAPVKSPKIIYAQTPFNFSGCPRYICQ
jgi:hypothetical protein